MLRARVTMAMKPAFARKAGFFIASSTFDDDRRSRKDSLRKRRSKIPFREYEIYFWWTSERRPSERRTAHNGKYTSEPVILENGRVAKGARIVKALTEASGIAGERVFCAHTVAEAGRNLWVRWGSTRIISNCVCGRPWKRAKHGRTMKQKAKGEGNFGTPSILITLFGFVVPKRPRAS